MLILNFFLLKGGMLFCYDVAMYQSKDGKPLNRLMASRGRSFKQTSLALVHEVGAVLCALHFLRSLYRHGIAFVHKDGPLPQLSQVAFNDFQNSRPNKILSPVFLQEPVDTSLPPNGRASKDFVCLLISAMLNSVV